MALRLPPADYLKRVAEVYRAKRFNTTATALELGKPRTTVQYWIDHLKSKGEIKDDWENTEALLKTIESLRTENAALREQVIPPPKFTIRSDALRPRAEKIKVLAIGDAHDSPHLPDKSRFEWMGAFADESKPDVIVQTGDLATLDSLNTHIPNETFNGRAKKTFLDDIGSLNLALDAFNSRLNFSPEKHVTLGNHERRLFAFEDQAPETMGLMQKEIDICLTGHNWTYSPYGEPTFYGGVAFLHAALNRLGKTYGGKTAENQIANDTLTDVVLGHSHVKRVVKFPKLHHRYVTVANVGCALPEGFIEDYAKHAVTGWSYGVMELTIRNGHIESDKWFSMNELRERYA